MTDAHVGPLYATRAAAALDRAGVARLATRRGGGAGPEVSEERDEGAPVVPVGPAGDGGDGVGADDLGWVMGVGEAAKTPATVRALWEALAAAGLRRDDRVLALGGGVVTDTAGFVAATALRGVGWLAAPTTLLAMVDAALGGKTGVNLGAGKNLAGAFHQPDLVVADPATLATLPPSVLREGLGEVVKAALVGDPALLEALEAHGAPGPGGWTALVARAAAVKAGIVAGDPREGEGGRRVLLNLGHTVAHGLERATGYALPHGEAVAVGLVAEADLAARLGLADRALAPRIAALLEALGLPTTYEGASPEAVVAATAGDKKRDAGGARLVLPVQPGEARLLSDVPREALLAAVAARRAPRV